MLFARIIISRHVICENHNISPFHKVSYSKQKVIVLYILWYIILVYLKISSYTQSLYEDFILNHCTPGRIRTLISWSVVKCSIHWTTRAKICGEAGFRLQCTEVHDLLSRQSLFLTGCSLQYFAEAQGFEPWRRLITDLTIFKTVLFTNLSRPPIKYLIRMFY